MRADQLISRLLAAMLVLAASSSAFAADDGAWTVSKSSGEVWHTSTGAQPASLNKEEFLKPGDTIRTGNNGRVLLKRGEETMMISPNSVVGVPAQKAEGLSTTIIQQAGSILLDVEKRNVKHFEVETPYLAAVVKGTQFRVTVNATSTSVDVIRGQVEVADLRTGQIAQVKPGQHATTFANGKGGLALGGSGSFSPIEQGKPRTPAIERVPVPRAGLTAPRNASVGHAIQPTGQGARGAADKTSDKASHRAGVTMPKHSGIRISSAIGEVKVNVHKVTHGLARDKSSVHAGNRTASNKDTVWSSSSSGTTSAASSTVQSSSGNTATTSASATAASTVATTVAAVTGSGTSSNSSKNGNDDNDNNGGRNRRGANGDGRGDRDDHNRHNNRHSDRNGNGNGNGNGNNGNGRGRN